MYKPLTNNAKSFINTVVNSNTNNFSGSLPYVLGRSNASGGTTFTAQPIFRGAVISDAKTFADALITWYNQYGELYSLDANIIAAQMFVESGYNLWQYSNSDGVTKSSAMGICQLYDNEIWDLFFTDTRAEIAQPKDQCLYDNQLKTMGLNLTGDLSDVRNVIPYLDNSTPDSYMMALANRTQLFQNIMDNPEMIIQVHCRYMSEIGNRNNNLASSALFAYVVDGYMTSKTYNDAINIGSNANIPVTPGINYVDSIFKVLGGKYKSTLKGFGKDYTYDSMINDQANKNLSSSIVVNQSMIFPPVGTEGTYPVDTVKKIVISLKKFGITNQYLQTGILAVISTEGTFTPRSEFSYAKTPNDRLRIIFGTRLSDLTDTQLGLLKSNDQAFYAKVYEGDYGSKYGNTTYGDGFKYRGRGFNAITFKQIYANVGADIGVDIVSNPDLLNTIPIASDAVASYFASYFATATKLGIPSKRYSINSFNDVDNITLGVQVAFQANAGWNTNLTTSVYPAEFRKQLANAGKLHEITVTV